MAVIPGLSDLMPKSEKVQIGTVVLTMHEATIDRAELLFQAVAGLELERLIQPISGLFSGGLKAALAMADKAEKTKKTDKGDDETDETDKGDEKKKDSAGILSILEQNADAIIQAVRPLLGKQLAPALRSIAIAMLDTPSTRKALITAPPEGEPPLKLIDAADIETDDDGVYLGSRAVRAWIRQSMTLRQGVQVVLTGLRVNDIAGAVGNLVTGLIPSADAEVAPADKPAPTKGPRPSR